MEASFTMEVLLMTNTGLSKREYIERDESLLKSKPQQNKLAEACWNGLVPVMLPELFEAVGDQNFMMWQLEEGRHSLYMQIGNQPVAPEPVFGLNAWVLLENAGQN